MNTASQHQYEIDIEDVEPRLSIRDSEVTYTLPLMLNEWIGSNDIH